MGGKKEKRNLYGKTFLSLFAFYLAIMLLFTVVYEQTVVAKAATDNFVKIQSMEVELLKKLPAYEAEKTPANMDPILSALNRETQGFGEPLVYGNAAVFSEDKKLIAKSGNYTEEQEHVKKNDGNEAFSPDILKNLKETETLEEWYYGGTEGFWQVKATDIQHIRSDEIMENGEYREYYMVLQTIFYPWPTTLKTLLPIYLPSLIAFFLIALLLSKKLWAIYQKQEAFEKNRRQLTDSMAHSLKSHIGIIRAYTQSLLETINDKGDAQLDGIADEVEKMDAMVMEMLVTSKREAKRVVAKATTISSQKIENAIRESREVLPAYEGEQSATNIAQVIRILNNAEISVGAPYLYGKAALFASDKTCIAQSGTYIVVREEDLRENLTEDGNENGLMEERFLYLEDDLTEAQIAELLQFAYETPQVEDKKVGDLFKTYEFEVELYIKGLLVQ